MHWAAFAVFLSPQTMVLCYNELKQTNFMWCYVRRELVTHLCTLSHHHQQYTKRSDTAQEPQPESAIVKHMRKTRSKGLEAQICHLKWKNTLKVTTVWVTAKPNKHDKSMSAVRILWTSVTKVQTITFIMNGNEYLPLFPADFISSWVWVVN